MKKTLLGIFLLIAVLVVGCSTNSPKTSDPLVITHPTWWNFYKRGRIHLQNQNWQAAKSDFETALGQKSGARYPYPHERWRARTYGVHMLEGYFPHRELGITLYNLGDFKAAKELLETSLNMEPSSRARFYLTRIEKELAVASAPPPQIQTDPLPQWSSQRSLQIKGAAFGSNPVHKIFVNENPQFVELAAQEIHFEQQVSLKEGRNQIPISVEDTSGKPALTNLVVMADWTPPEFFLQRNGPNIKVICRDNHQLKQIIFNGQTTTPEKKQHVFDWDSNTMRFELMLVDAADNAVEWNLSNEELQHITAASKSSMPRIHLANGGKTIVQNVAEYQLDIRADDDTALTTLQLNGQHLISRPTPLFRTVRRIPLEAGENNLAITAQDADGNRSDTHITIIYKKPEYIDSIYRLAAVQSPLAGEIPDLAFARRTRALLNQELTSPPVRFHLLSSGEEVHFLENEHTLSESTLADTRAALKQGKKMDADLVFISQVLSDAPGQTVYIRVLEASSGDELFVEDVYVENPMHMPRSIEGLVMKIEQRFPLIMAQAEKNQKQFIIPAGSKEGARKGMRLLLIRSDGSFEEGRLLMHEGRPAEVTISEVEQNRATVVLSDRKFPNIQTGDFVYSR